MTIDEFAAPGAPPLPSTQPAGRAGRGAQTYRTGTELGDKRRAVQPWGGDAARRACSPAFGDVASRVPPECPLTFLMTSGALRIGLDRPTARLTSPEVAGFDDDTRSRGRLPGAEGKRARRDLLLARTGEGADWTDADTCIGVSAVLHVDAIEALAARPERQCAARRLGRRRRALWWRSRRMRSRSPSAAHF